MQNLSGVQMNFIFKDLETQFEEYIKQFQNQLAGCIIEQDFHEKDALQDFMKLKLTQSLEDCKDMFIQFVNQKRDIFLFIKYEHELKYERNKNQILEEELKILKRKASEKTEEEDNCSCVDCNVFDGNPPFPFETEKTNNGNDDCECEGDDCECDDCDCEGDECECEDEDCAFSACECEDVCMCVCDCEECKNMEIACNCCGALVCDCEIVIKKIMDRIPKKSDDDDEFCLCKACRYQSIQKTLQLSLELKPCSLLLYDSDNTKFEKCECIKCKINNESLQKTVEVDNQQTHIIEDDIETDSLCY